jgi:predicted AlkP superfamily pyrophosphatase or phosphodiesterase
MPRVKRFRFLRRIAWALLAVVLAVGVALWLTGGEYPPASARRPEVAQPSEFRLPPGAPSRSPAKRTVVVLLFDGVAPALVGGGATPALDRLGREGTWTHDMVPPFPSISLISGFTISTGCWPEHHGVVTNRFFDPERGFYDHSKDADWATGCEHLHEAAERQGVPAATLGWYGEVSSKRGKLARRVVHAVEWSDYPSDRDRARQVVDLLALPAAERPQLILAYFKGPDGAEHFRGMDSPEVRAAVAEMDGAVATVLAAVEKLGDAALIVTTDHGMVPITHLINIEYILRRHRIAARVAATGTTAFLYLDDRAARTAAIHALSGYPQFDLILPEEQPEWSHVGKGPRAGDLIVSAKPPYAIEDRGQFPWFLRWIAWTGPELIDASRSLKASHGYPPDTPGVRGVFYAWGSGVRRDNHLARIDAVDIHPTVTALLGIEPGRPVDGKAVR